MSASASIKKLSADLGLSVGQEIAIMVWLLENKVILISESELISMIDNAFDKAKKDVEATKTIQ